MLNSLQKLAIIITISFCIFLLVNFAVVLQTTTVIWRNYLLIVTSKRLWVKAFWCLLIGWSTIEHQKQLMLWERKHFRTWPVPSKWQIMENLVRSSVFSFWKQSYWSTLWLFPGEAATENNFHENIDWKTPTLWACEFSARS